MKRSHLWWAVLSAALAFAALPLLLERLAEPPAELRLRTADFGETVDSDRMRTRTLPHRWQVDCPDCRTVWYRFDVSLPDLPRETQAIYLPAVGENAGIYLNGRLLGQGGRFADPAARLGRQPLWVAAPSATWVAGSNVLYVLVKAERPGAGLMPAPVVGPESAVAAASRLRQALAATLPQMFATASVVLALMAAALAYYRRQEPVYVALALASIAFAANAFTSLVIEPPVAGRLWDAWLVLSAWLVTLTSLLLALRLAAAGRIGRVAMPVVTVAAVVAAAMAGLAPALLTVDDNLALGRAVLVLVGLGLAARGWRDSNGGVLWAGVVLALLSLVDLLRLPAQPEALPAQPWAMAALLGAAGWLSIVRFVDTLNAAELLNVDLEAMVRQRTAALETQFERVRELERRQTIAAERERLMRDMHDGVGGHLVSMLAMIEADRRRPGELAVVVRDALDDMRLMIDSLDPVDDDLNAVLAMFRDRLAPRLRASNVTLHWDVELLPAVPGLTPARVLHVLRMLQEAVTNALRHGRAHTLWIAATQTGAGIRIDVRDDGCGFDPDAATGGRGLKNLRRRASEIGARLDITSVAGQGTTVSLLLATP